MYLAFKIVLSIIMAAVIAAAVYENKKKSFSFDSMADNNFWGKVSALLDKYWYVILTLTFVVYLVTRLFRLDSLPMGIHIDELGAATDAKMIRDFGTDRYGVRYPFYFQNYGRGQSGMYLYLVSLLIRFLPCSIYTLRLPAVICGALCMFAMFGICKEMTDSRKWGLVGAILVTILPVFVMSERWGLDAFLMLPISTCFMYFAIRAVKYEIIRDWIITGIVMGLTLYTYATTHITLPVMVALTGIYLIVIGKFKWKQVLSLAIPLFIIALPLIVFNLVDLGIIAPFSTFTSDFIPLPEAREHELSIGNFVANIPFLVNMFSGKDDLTYNVFPEFGTIYTFLVIPMLIGLGCFAIDFIKSIKEKRFSYGALLLFYDLGLLIFVMLVRGPNVNRANGLYMSFAVFIFWGIYKIMGNKPVCLTITGVMSAAYFAFFMLFYLFMQDDVYGHHLLHATSYPMKAVPVIEENYLKDGGKIYIMIEDEAFYPESMMYYAAASKDEKYDPEVKQYGNVILGFPEEFDENENAVYMIGENWHHISDYIISVGFNQDYRYPGYVILYK